MGGSKGGSLTGQHGQELGLSPTWTEGLPEVIPMWGIWRQEGLYVCEGCASAHGDLWSSQPQRVGYGVGVHPMGIGYGLGITGPDMGPCSVYIILSITPERGW